MDRGPGAQAFPNYILCILGLFILQFLDDAQRIRNA